jgi:hypothetical protein
MLHPLQSAPVIVIRSDKKLAIAHATPAIIKLFDPRHVTNTNPSGFAYEGYFPGAAQAERCFGVFVAVGARRCCYSTRTRSLPRWPEVLTCVTFPLRRKCRSRLASPT